LLRFLFSLRLCFLRLPNGDYNALNESAIVVLDFERKMAKEQPNDLRRYWFIYRLLILITLSLSLSLSLSLLRLLYVCFSRIAQIQKLYDVDRDFNPLELDTPSHCALHLEVRLGYPFSFVAVHNSQRLPIYSLSIFNTTEYTAAHCIRLPFFRNWRFFSVTPFSLLISSHFVWELSLNFCCPTPDAYINQLQEELRTVHLQSAQMADQIGLLTKIHNDGLSLTHSHSHSPAPTIY